MSLAADLQQWDREHVWHAFSQMAEYRPFIIRRAHGCRLIDIHGREYLDGVSSLWCNVHGHRHPRIDTAIRDQLDQVAHVSNLEMSTVATIWLAKRLTDLAPPGLRHVFFSGDGSCAIEVALKMAVQYWRQRADPRPGKNRFLAFGEAYHGDTLGSVSVGGVARFQEMFRPLLFETIRLPLPDSYRLPHECSDGTAAEYYLRQLADSLEQNHRTLAAVVIEPLLQCAAGMVRHPPGFLRGVRELTSRHDILLIADEVAVGFGRTGTLFACEQEQVAPDFLCLGKGLTGGYLPMAATMTTDTIWQAFLGDYGSSRTFFHGHTYGGNPLAAAAAVASLEIFDEEQTLVNLPRKSEVLSRHLARIAQLPQVGNVRQCGLIAGIELVRDRTTREPFPWSERRGQRVCDFALSQGVWLRPLGNVVVIMPPLAINEDELAVICEAVYRGIVAAVG